MDSSYDGTQSALVEVADVIGHKWHPVIVHQLLTAGELGFSDLGSRVTGISNKMLSDSLTTLEDDGIVERRIVSEKPVRVRYSLTERGQAMETLLAEMLSWGRDHFDTPPTEELASPVSPVGGVADE